MTVAPTMRSAASAIEPVPLAAHVAPGDAVQVHVAPVSAAGSESVIGADTTFDGPSLRATIVYVTGVPGIAVLAASVFVIDSAAAGSNVSVSVEVSSDGLVSRTPDGGATVAVFEIVPVADAPMVPDTM